ncbi:hypothetical protein I79_022124 [Cricetulus griseus]|uniref:Uncharacterized protein n=1 Tax=Cricetulus griseus TaxID=10029 RepID=G3IEH7_CRIGR|nr:hypothetical protein I79_022124 [Cricetulus griseus]
MHTGKRFISIQKNSKQTIGKNVTHRQSNDPEGSGDINVMNTAILAKRMVPSAKFQISR